jgi:hypothetical protein
MMFIISAFFFLRVFKLSVREILLPVWTSLRCPDHGGCFDVRQKRTVSAGVEACFRIRHRDSARRFCVFDNERSTEPASGDGLYHVHEENVVVSETARRSG